MPASTQPLQQVDPVTTMASATPTATDVCDVCGHDMDVHDRISSRYCNATQTRGLTRGCMCPADSLKH